MKDTLGKLFGWMLVSNRKKHLLAGWIEAIVFLLAYGILALLLGFNVDGDSGGTVLNIVSGLNVLSCCCSMCTVEYIQKSQGGRWDWLDIVSGILPPVLIFVLIVLLP